MLVKNWMKSPVITLDINDSMADAMKLLDTHNIHMLPVLENIKIVGIITDRDLKKAEAAIATTVETYEPKKYFSEMKIRSLMPTDVVSIPLDNTVEEAAEILSENKISGAPVIDDSGDLVGVITKTDIFEVLISLTGLKRRGIQYALRVKDSPGSIKEVTEIIRKYGGRMASILSSYDDVPEGYRKVYIGMYNIDRFKLFRLNAELSEVSKIIYMVDRHDPVRQIF